MISHIFIFGFITLLTITMELTWPVKGRSFVEGKECATTALAEQHVKSISVLEFENDSNEFKGETQTSDL
jgi:hypothetical protein